MTRPNQGLSTGRRENLGTRLRRMDRLEDFLVEYPVPVISVAVV